ncbi:TPA: hypothetical protein MM166_004284 [Klebsiella pneumoniae]|nr:hypothetical protein [Klebsiella pneumoniae]
MAKVLPALERNIIKYRSMQVLIFSFYIEDFKRVIESTLKFELIYTHFKDYQDEKPPSHMGEAMDMLERKGLISREDRTEYAQLVKYRNQTSHEIELMFFDLTQDDAADIYKAYKAIKYDYECIDRIKRLRNKVLSNLSKKLLSVVSMRENMFEDVEKTFNHEMKKLELRIEKGINKRAEKIKDMLNEI